MTREAAIEELRRLTGLGDWEREKAHIQADNVLCQLLETLGYEDVVEEFDNVGKWYS